MPTRASLALLTLAGAAVLALTVLRSTGGRGGQEDPDRRVPRASEGPEPSPAAPLPARVEAPPTPTDAPEANSSAQPAATLPPSDPARRAAAVPSAPVAHLAGAVADPLGQWVSELPLHWRTGRQIVRSTMSDVFGAFQLADLPCVPGELVLGDPANPVTPPRALELRPGVTDLGTIEVPLLGELVLRVLDEAGRPVPDVGLSGVGNQGGSIAARSGPDGEVRVRLLPRGMYRVFGSHPDLGRGNTIFEYAPDSPRAIEVLLRRKSPPE